MITPTAIASEVARHRHRDLVGRADRYRLSRQVNHPASLLWSKFGAVLLRWLLCSRPRGSATPMSHHPESDVHVLRDASEEDTLTWDLALHRSQVRASAP